MVVADTNGTPVELTDERWAHILDGHPEMRGWRGSVLDAVRSPTIERAGRRDNERWCYAEGVGPSRWLKVVVAYHDGRGYIVTALARRSFP